MSARSCTDRVVSQREYAGTGTKSETLKSSTDFTYASKTNYLTGVKHYSPLGTQSITYTYGSLANGQMPDQVYSVKWNGTEKVKYTYDAFGRLTNKKVGTFNNTYTYHNYGTARTTTLGMSVTTPAGKYAYTYDKSDKVVSYTDGTHKTTYAYDDLNQLVRENNPKTGKTYTYSYKNGNITQRNEYAYTTGELGAVTATKKWTYGDTVWKDLLTNFNGEAVTYDTIGNPTKIGSKTLTWNGRQLAKYVNGSSTTSYAYNGDGQRISKTVNGTKTDYYYNGSILAGQKTGSNTLVFMYDNNGDAFGFKYNGTEYFYVKNLQNDITAITDASGKVIANYYYDAWGNITSTTGNTTIANANPLRYRSYYYDTDTKLYYLNTRYYSPDMSRFLNADGYIQTGQGVLDKNMFAYCFNNPLNKSDSNGNNPAVTFIAEKAVEIIIFALIASALIVSTNVLTKSNTNSTYNSSNSVINAVELLILLSFVAGAVGQGLVLSVPKTKAKEESKEKVVPKTAPTPQKRPAVFPINPHNFNPRGLIKMEYPGTKNGRIIKWMDPISKSGIFEWNEDFRMGPHYHVMMLEWDGEHQGIHYQPGTPVPEPWQSIYFGG